MRKLMSFFVALVLGLGFTFISGVVDNTYAKTAIEISGSIPVVLGSQYSNWKSSGPGIGVDVIFGTNGRLSGGVNLMFGQKMQKPGWEYDEVSDLNGENVYGAAEVFHVDISRFNIPRDPNYLLMYSTKTRKSVNTLVTGTFYISPLPKRFLPRSDYQPTWELKFGLTVGGRIVRDETSFKYHYDDVIAFLVNGPLTPGDGVMYPGDDGSGHGRQIKLKYEPVGSVLFKLGFHPAEHFVIPLEVKYFSDQEASVRAGLGLVF